LRRDSVTVAYYSRGRRRRRALDSGTAVVGSKLFTQNTAENTASAPGTAATVSRRKFLLGFSVFPTGELLPIIAVADLEIQPESHSPLHVRVFANNLPGTATTRRAKKSSPLAERHSRAGTTDRYTSAKP